MSSVPLSHLLFELSSYAVFAVCFRHAWRQGPRRRERLAILLTGTVYGVLLELLTIYQLHAYRYGGFVVVFNGEVPLVIGLGWGMILYAAIAVADALPLSPLAWSAFVGLWGLAIDATMDVMAARTEMWSWFQVDAFDGRIMMPDQDWYGVLLGNYFAWFVVLVSASTFVRLFVLGSKAGVPGLVLRAGAAIASSLVTLAALDQLYMSYTPHRWWPIALEVLLGAAAVASTWLRKDGAVRDRAALEGAPALAVPSFFHLYFLGLMVAALRWPSIIPGEAMRERFPTQAGVLVPLSAVLVVGTLLVHRLAAGRGSARLRAEAFSAAPGGEP